MNTLTGYSKSRLTDNYVLTAAGGHLAVGNASNNIPLNNSTVNTNLNADLLDGLHGSWYLKNAISFKLTKGVAENQGYDVNTLTEGMVYNYGSAGYWKNGPSGMSYGLVLNLKNGSSNSLSGQLAWDVSHNNTTDTTRSLWWRASDNGTFTNAQWHKIAFLESIPNVTDYYWANIPISPESNEATAPKVSRLYATNGINTSYIRSNSSMSISSAYNITLSANDSSVIKIADTFIIPLKDDTVNLGTPYDRWSAIYTKSLTTESLNYRCKGSSEYPTMYFFNDTWTYLGFFGMNYEKKFVIADQSGYSSNYVLHSGNSSVSGGGSSWGSSITVKMNSTTATLTIPSNPNTWRPITNSYSGTAIDTSLSLKGANDLYNALVNGNASTLDNLDSTDFLRNVNLNGTFSSAANIPTNLTAGVHRLHIPGVEYSSILTGYDLPGNYWQLYFHPCSGYTLDIRYRATNCSTWKTLLDSNNYNDYSPKLNGTGASGTWGINITGSAGSVAWGNITGKPGSFTPASHTHTYIESKANYTFTSSTLPNSFDWGVSAGFVADTSGFGSYGSVLTVRTYSGGGGTLQLYAPYSNTYGGSRLKARFGNYDSNTGNSWTSLKELAWLGDIPTKVSLLTNDSGYITGSYLPTAGGTLTGPLTISYTTSTTMSYSSTNPQIVFAESGTLPVKLIYTDYDSYRAPAGLKVIGSEANAWFEVDGTVYSKGFYHNSYGSSAYALTSNGGVAKISDMSVSYATSAGSASSAGTCTGNAKGLTSSGYGSGNLTYYQTDGSFFGNSGWSHYIIANHGDGSSYYNYTLALPFWDVPKYKRLEGGTGDGWHTFITSENISTQSVKYASSAGSVAWGNITGKPSFFSGNYNDLTNKPSIPSFGTKGSATKGVYLSGTNTFAEMTYSLHSTVNSGTSGKLAYYSGANAISAYTSTRGDYYKPIYLSGGVPIECYSRNIGSVTWGTDCSGYIQVKLFGPIVILQGYFTKINVNQTSSTNYVFKLPTGTPSPATTVGITLSLEDGYENDRNTIIMISGQYGYCNTGYNSFNPKGWTYYFSACYMA